MRPIKSSRAAACPALEQRADPRIKSAFVVRVANLSQQTETRAGLLLDRSTRGMKIRTALPFSVGDVVRIDLPESTVLTEVVHFSGGVSEEIEVGLKLRLFVS
jgi:PilZ domain